MKKIKNIFALLVVALVGLSLTACSSNDLDTNQYKDGISLNAFGPNPVMRGGQLRFVGSNLDQIASIQIPGVSPITNYETIKSGVPSEIRVTVPKDGPTVGKVILTTKDNQTLSTKNDLSYIEGIEITGFTPASAMPGDVIKIEGDYLNLIYSMAFADGVLVSNSDFVSQDRYYIEVKVPEEAQTGKLEFYTADLTIQRTAEEEEELEYQTIVSEEALEVGVPSITSLTGRNTAEALGNITAKAGETITIAGTYFNVVADVTIGGVSAADLKIANDGKGITFTLPAEAPDGDIVIVCKSEVEVPVGTLTTIKPTEGVAAPNPVKAGQALTITGKDMDIVTAVLFDNANEVTGENITVAADKVVVKEVPDKAIEGNLKLKMANGLTVEVPFTLVKPTVTAYNPNPSSAGSALTIQGTDLDLVKTVQFGEGSDVVEVKDATAESITLTIPMNAKSGAPIFTLANGKTVENAPEITVNEALFCYITELPGEETELKAGESMTVPVANGDKLTGVEINGAACQFVLTNDNQLIIGIPIKAKKGAKVRLISSNGEITYTIDFIPNTEVTTVLWTGTAVADDWGNQPYVLSDAGQELKDAGVVVGDIISFHISPMSSDWKLQIIEGHWGPTYASICSFGNDTEGGKFTEYDLEANKGYFNLEVTQEMLDAAFTQQWWGGVFVLNGDNVVVDKITTTHYESVEETLWEGEAIADDWGNQPYLLSDAGIELAAIEAKAGQTIYFYFTPLEDAWKVQIYEGHWGPTYASICSFGNDTEGGKFTEYDLAGNKGKYGLVLTQEMLNAAFTQQWWGGTFLLNGDNIKCTKITIE
jgi:hypothetical protein